MSESTPVSAAESSPVATQKRRSAVERMIVWGGITLLLGLLAFEARQKYSYDPTVARLRRELSEKPESTLRLTQIRSMIVGSPIEVLAPHELRVYNRIDMKWPSLFKDYRIQLIVEREGDDPLVAGFSTPEGTDPEARDQSANSIATAESSNVAPTMLPMGGPGMGGPGRPGGPAAPGVIIPAMGGGGGTPRGLYGIAQRDEVIAELKLTEGQSLRLSQLQNGARMSFQSLMGVPEQERLATMQKMRSEQEQLVAEVLDQQQFTRLMQLVWRETGLAAVERNDVAQKLGLSDDQRAALSPILAERQAAQRQLRMATAEVVAQKRKEWEDKIRAILTEEQVKLWDELLGSPAPEQAKLGSAPT